jgi:hypothetical protein
LATQAAAAGAGAGVGAVEGDEVGAVAVAVAAVDELLTGVSPSPLQPADMATPSIKAARVREKDTSFRILSILEFIKRMVTPKEKRDASFNSVV